ncbi:MULTISPECIES: 4-alpha-glucanotransferase [unclassified Luteococcus]|uniref:4-alpha-glucanotransferase n=1 Tax=unclassified Luteococcus TaxID=2639923 RepID=UPI00313D6A9D
MALDNPLLAELADHFGIASEFWDWKGRQTQISEETVVAVLKSLEIDASTPQKAQEAVDELRMRPWRRSLPPCVVLEQGQPGWVNVHVNSGADAELYLRLENGETRPTWQSTNDAPDREIDGQWIGEATFQLPADLPLGYHRMVLRSQGVEVESSLIITPSFLGLPASMNNRRIWGYATQLYSVRSKNSWGVGDLTDLADLSVWSATQQFAGYVLVNPLHAAQPMPPLEPSPYLPTSRMYVNPLYIRPEAIEEYATLSEADRRQIQVLRDELLQELGDVDEIRRNPSWEKKAEALRLIFASGRRAAREMAFNDFIRREGRQLRDFATWCALYEVHGPDWRQWPAELQRPTSPQVAEFYRANQQRIQFYKWLQWIAENQLSSTQQAARDAGMPIGIVSDLAVGVNAAGAETWMLSDVFAQGCTVGAPPDAYSQLGQDWGQPPWRPDRLADLAYAPFRQMVQNVLRHAGGLRVDHIIGLFRLWWVPQGKTAKDGTYVRYDHDALIGILALEAHRAQALVIGEDLGTVQPWVREYLSRRGLLGTSVMWFEQGDDGHPLPPESWREYAMSSVTTHDLPPTSGYLAGDHIRLRDKLGMLTESLESELEHGRAEQQAMIEALRNHGALSQQDYESRDVEQIVLAMHRMLTWTPSKVLNAALVDAVGDRRTQNQPGTIDEYPNWRVPLSGPDGAPMRLEDVYASERATRLAAVMNGYSQLPDKR